MNITESGLVLFAAFLVWVIWIITCLERPMTDYVCTMNEMCCGKEHREGCPYFLNPDLIDLVETMHEPGSINELLDMTDEELESHILGGDEQTVAVLRESLTQTVTAAKAAYDSLENGAVNYLTVKHVKEAFDQVQSVNLFVQMVASPTPKDK